MKFHVESDSRKYKTIQEAQWRRGFLVKAEPEGKWDKKKIYNSRNEVCHLLLVEDIPGDDTDDEEENLWLAKYTKIMAGG